MALPETLTVQKADPQLLQHLDETEKEEAGAALSNSFAGRMGRAIEPIIAPPGF